VTPGTSQWTAFQEDTGADARAVLDGVPLYLRVEAGNIATGPKWIIGDISTIVGLVLWHTLLHPSYLSPFYIDVKQNPARGFFYADLVADPRTKKGTVMKLPDDIEKGVAFCRTDFAF
jgi:hypothetical protein